MHTPHSDNDDNSTDTELIREKRGLINLVSVPSPAWENSTVPFVFEKGLRKLMIFIRCHVCGN